LPRFRASGRGLTRSRLFTGVLTLLLVAGCISEEREQTIGDTMALEVNPHLRIIDDPALTGYLYSVGRNIGKQSSRPDLEYDFYIVNTPVVNAFALPGGHIYLTRGLIERTDDGAEFAGVLAHEIGHVAARHGVRKLQRQLRTGSLVNVLYNTILGGEPQLLRQNSLQLANTVWSARHSRNDEREADRLAVDYLVETGVDPRAVVTLLETLQQEEGSEADTGPAVDWFSTHPLTESRIEDARQRIEAIEGEIVTRPNMNLLAFPAFKALLMERGVYGQSEMSW
jgi:predicted Zn-dependent protease